MPNTLIGNLQGPAGAAGAPGAAGQGYTWLGQWVGTTAYVPYDTVYQNGSSFDCVAPNTGIDPTTDNGTHWALMARIGNPGVAGPAGGSGPAGPPGISTATTTASFVVPAVGQTVQVTVTDASWIVVGQMINVASAGGTNISGALQVEAINGNTLTLLNPSAPGTPPAGPQGPPGAAGAPGAPGPSAVSADAGNLATLGSDSLIYVPGTRYNAIGNSTFEIDQRNVGTIVTPPAPPGSSALFAMDRWLVTRATPGGGTLNATWGQVAANVVWPPTGAIISSKCLQVTLTAQQASMGSTSGQLTIGTQIEGPMLRELFYGVHSLQLVAWSSVAPVSFSVQLRSLSGGSSIYNFCTLFTINTANTWTLFQLPNIPIWPSAANPAWSVAPGTLGYYLEICLACSSNIAVAAANQNIWWTGGTTVRPGASAANFNATPNGSIFQVGFVQHEPGPACTAPIDKPFDRNLDECLRYFQKSYDYPNAVGSTGVYTNVGFFQAVSSTTCLMNAPFRKQMAKTPTVVCYSTATGTANSVRDATAALDRGITTYNVGMNGIQSLILGSAPAAGAQLGIHYTADTGW